MTSSSADLAEKPVHAQRQSHCVVCGPDHPHELKIGFDTGADGAAVAAGQSDALTGELRVQFRVHVEPAGNTWFAAGLSSAIEDC